MFLPTKSAAGNALATFLPKSAGDYAKKRNYDAGPESESTVSRLSPWIRIRMLPEWEVVTTVLERDSESEASKFIDEVCWRTYWKGWLQLRPSVWQHYLKSRAKLLGEFGSNVAYQKAIKGRTGIECFDAWNTELLEGNYLHNHTRMWYASIWIHSLKLPWQLGADWFLRHLLDGDPASNTLSWRWVGGLQTRGKTYLARPENIRKYTNNRFSVKERLATEPLELDEPILPQPENLPQPKRAPAGLRLGLLVTEEDLSAIDWLPEIYPVATTATYFPTAAYENLSVCPEVIDFRYRALSSLNAEERLEDNRQCVEWARKERLDALITAEPTVGHWPEILASLKAELAANKIELFTERHWWDEILFPHATRGFFRFKKAIPSALEKLSQSNAKNPCDA